MFYFSDFEDLAEYMFEKTDNEDNLVSVISDKETAVEIMRELLNYEDVILDSCEILNDNDYDREYFVSLYDDRDSVYWYVNVEKAYCEENEKYLSTVGFILFHEDTNSKAMIDMQNNSFSPLKEYDWFVISEDEDNDTEESNAGKNPLPSEDVNEVYMVNGKKTDKETYQKIMKELDKENEDFFKRQLLSYCEFMDEMNRFRRLLSW